MKKSSIIILSLVIIIIFLIIIIFVINVYFNKVILGYNNVISYGPEMTLGEVIAATGNYDSEIYKLLTIKLKKAITRSLGNTARKKYYIDNNQIIFVGNRNLVIINGETYIYLTEPTELLQYSY